MKQMAPSHTKLTVWSYCVQSLLDAQRRLALSPLPLHDLVGQVALKISHAEGSEQGPPCSHWVTPCGLGAQAIQNPLGWAFSSSVETWMSQEAGEACCPLALRLRDRKA